MAEVCHPLVHMHPQDIDIANSKLNALRSACEGQLEGSLEEERDRRLVEFNVIEQIQSLRIFPQVASAIGSRGLKIHGLVYDRSKNEAIRLEVETRQLA